MLLVISFIEIFHQSVEKRIMGRIRAMKGLGVLAEKWYLVGYPTFRGFLKYLTPVMMYILVSSYLETMYHVSYNNGAMISIMVCFFIVGFGVDIFGDTLLILKVKNRRKRMSLFILKKLSVVAWFALSLVFLIYLFPVMI